jgi:hypothetical protein
MPHPMAEQWMDWKALDTAPTNRDQILVGFMGQFKWISYVAPANGLLTGSGMPFAPPTHWTPIDPPLEHR